MALPDELAALPVTKNSDRAIIRRAVEALRAAETIRTWLDVAMQDEAINGRTIGNKSLRVQARARHAAYAAVLKMLDERPIAAKEGA